MNSTAQLSVVTCMDPRVKRPVREYLEARGYPEGTYTFHTTPGASIQIKKLQSDLELAINKFGSNQIWILDHEDCLAFKHWNGCDRRLDHLRQLDRAFKWLAQEFVGVIVRTFYVPTSNSESIEERVIAQAVPT